MNYYEDKYRERLEMAGYMVYLFIAVIIAAVIEVIRQAFN